MSSRESAIKYVGNNLGQFLGYYVIIRVLTTGLFYFLSWVFATQERKKERKGVDGERQVSPIIHFRMQIVQKQQDHPTRGSDLGPYGRTEVVVRRGPG